MWTVPFTRYTSSREPAADFSPTSSPASRQSAPSRSRSFRAESSPDASPEWESGTTCGRSDPTTQTAPTPSAGSAPTELHLSYRAAFHARTFLRPEKGRASPARVPGFGASSQESFANFDRPSRSWKIPPCLFIEDSTAFSGTWPKSGLMRAGMCYRLPPWAPDTNGNGSGSPPEWPTPTVCGNDNHAGLSPKAGDGLATRVKRREGGGA